MSYTEKFPFSGPIEGYVKNFLRKNHWRVQHILDFEDSVSEAKLTYVRLIRRLEKNGHEVENAKHFMSLFKTAWSRYFIDLSNKDTKKLETPFAEFANEDNEDWLLNSAWMSGYSVNTGYFEIVMRQAPTEVQQVLNLLLNTPKEVLDIAALSWSTSGRDTTILGNAFLCKMLGYDSSKTNLVSKVKLYLTTE